MPLTNVWTRNRNGKMERTIAEKIDHERKWSVPASSHEFVCYSCLQYVAFVKGTPKVSPYFKHSKSEIDKSCEDRSFGTGTYRYGQDLTDVPDPIRFIFVGNSPCFEIGFFPVKAAAIEKAMKAGTKVRIKGRNGLPDEYFVDRSRFEPHTTTWIRLPFGWASDYRVDIEPMDQSLRVWDIKRTMVKPIMVFDGRTGRRIPKRSDITVSKEYYVFCDKGKQFYPREGIEFGHKIVVENKWCFYPMKVTVLNEYTSDFCLENFRLILTSLPSEIGLLWPPTVENEDVIDTNQKRLILHIQGESDLETFPNYGSTRKELMKLASNQKVYELDVVNALQMVSATRYSQRVKFKYIRPWEENPVIQEPAVKILDDKGQAIPDEMKRAPDRGIIRIESEVDATAEVESYDGFLYRARISAGQEARLMDIRQGFRITIRQGTEIVRKIEVGNWKKKTAGMELEDMPPWHGKMVPIPRRYAWMLAKIDRNSELYRRTMKAFQKGMIPLDGLKALNEMTGGK